MLHRAVHKVFYPVFCLFLIKLDVQIGVICKIPGNVVGWKAEVDSFYRVIVFLWERAANKKVLSHDKTFSLSIVLFLEVN